MSNAFLVHSITASSAKLPDWLIQGTEETLENNRRGPSETEIPCNGFTTKIILYSLRENSKIERRVRKTSVEK